MVEFSLEANYSYILNNNEPIQNKTHKLIYKKEKQSYNFGDFIILIIDILMVIGPSLGYFLQSLKFKKTKSSKGFSKSICLIIYTSHILRVFFWIGKPFKITLLYQSILIIAFQIYLIHLWIKYHEVTEVNKDINTSQNQNQINEFNYYDNKDFIEYLIDWSDTISPNKIWNWSNQIEYYKFMSIIVFILLLISGIVGIHNVVLTNIYGTISVTSEASTLIPQIIVSCKKKNASNLATSMVVLWLIGDSCKFVYNIKYHTPIQMIISGGLQIFLDFFALMQIFFYRNKNKKDKNENKTVEIIPKIKSKQVQQINQFMNIIEEKFDNIQKSDDDYNKKTDNSNKNINKIDVIERTENSDKVEVLDKSKEEHIKYASDDEDNNNYHHKIDDDEDIKNENNITNENLTEDDNKIDDNKIDIKN